MNILLLGGGGREHAFAWKISQSKQCGRLFIAPGNSGTATCGTNVPVDPNDFAAVKALALDKNIDMVVVGPEEPLVNGIQDFFQADELLQYIPLIGPSREGARLEGSKAFAKAFMQEEGIPTAAYREFTAASVTKGLDYIALQRPPIVLKADGLAAGKGVLIIDNVEEAQREFKAMLDGMFGKASEKVVVEEFLDGIEFSVFALTDGRTYKILPVAKDYKRAGEGDTGLNTGGMGSVSPVSFVDKALMDKVEQRIIRPTIEGIRKRRIAYHGFVFFGLISVGGDPFVIEYNCRMGDPETQVVLPRLKNDLVDLFKAVTDGRLDEVSIEEDERAAAAIILASGGYPGEYKKGIPVSGVERVNDSMVFHAGARSDNGGLVTSGGRVFAVASFGKDFRQALAVSLRNAEIIDFEGKYYRRDIGFDL
jgi:phosphoribosylamine---glycine ligase